MPTGYTEVPCVVCGKIRSYFASQPSLRPSDRCLRCAHTRPLEDRFWERVNKLWPSPAHRPDLGPCWLISYACGPHGYPVIFVPERLRTGAHSHTRCTHVVAFYLAHGHWPEPQANHRCDVKTCVKAVDDEFGPAHVIEGTQADNVVDMVQKGRNRNQNMAKTRCKYGHPLSGDNLRIVGRRRKCRQCSRRWDREASQRQRSKS